MSRFIFGLMATYSIVLLGTLIYKNPKKFTIGAIDPSKDNE